MKLNRLCICILSIFFLLAATACGINVKKAEVEFKQAAFDSVQVMDADIIYCDDEILIYKDFYGLFVYSFTEDGIVNSLDVKYIDCDMSQGDNACLFKSYNNGEIIELYKVNDESEAYYFDWKNSTLKDKCDLSNKKEDTRDNLSEYKCKDNDMLRYSHFQAEIDKGVVTLVCDSGESKDVEYLIEKDGNVIKREKIFK